MTSTPYGLFSDTVFAKTSAWDPSASASPHGLLNMCMYSHAAIRLSIDSDTLDFGMYERATKLSIMRQVSQIDLW